ncbi:UNVERIFIED_CONTAM: hypothetical protein K2H54_018507 [Gekko kuhli]
MQQVDPRYADVGGALAYGLSLNGIRVLGGKEQTLPKEENRGDWEVWRRLFPTVGSRQDKLLQRRFIQNTLHKKRKKPNRPLCRVRVRAVCRKRNAV